MQPPEPNPGKDPGLTTLSFGILATPGSLPTLPDSPAGRKTGKELERAVRFIQETILKSDPKLKGSEFTVETNKIVTVAGVRHEIDVLVKTLPDSQYQSTWIFECKDWKKPVGKKEVSDLKEKVRALAANRAFLVAKKISKDAGASIAQDDRLSHIPVTDNFFSPFNDLQLVHTSYDLLPIIISVKECGVPPKENPDTLDWKNADFRFKGKPADFMTYINRLVDQLVLEKRPDSQAQHLQTGNHFDKRDRTVTFQPGDLTINGAELEYMWVEVRFFINVERQKLLSKFELKNQGRCFSFAPLENVLPGKSLQIDLVHRL